MSRINYYYYYINHDTNIAVNSTSNIQNIQLDEPPPPHGEREETLSSNEEEVEAQVQTQQNNRK